MDVRDRRKHPRRAVSIAVGIQDTKGRTDEVVVFDVGDLSMSGIFLRSPYLLEEEEEVELNMATGHNQSVTARGKVVRVARSGEIGMGIAFESLDEGTRRAISKILDQQS